MRHLSKGFYISSIGGAGILGTIISYIPSIMLTGACIPGSIPTDARILDVIFIAVLGIILLLYAGVVALVWCYKIWNTIQDDYVRTTPGKAIGFLFIPFFNLYWAFQATWGFAKDYNSYLSRHGLSASKLPEKLFLAYCILALITTLAAGVLSLATTTGLVYAGLACYIINFIVFTIIASKVCDAINSLPQATES